MRIISLSPSLTETLAALGLSKDLVGVTEDSMTESLKCQTIGQPKTLEIEKIKNLKPDVLVTAFAENRPEEMRVLEKDSRVISFKVTSIPSLVSAIGDLGNIFEKQSEAKNLIREIYAQWQPPPKDPVRTAILVWNNPMMTVSSRSYISSLVEAAGGWNLYREDPLPEVAIELEEMLEQNPELLLLPSMPFAFETKHVDYFKTFPALRQKQVRLVEGRLFARFGPTTVEALKVLREVILSS